MLSILYSRKITISKWRNLTITSKGAGLFGSRKLETYQLTSLVLNFGCKNLCRKVQSSHAVIRYKKCSRDEGDLEIFFFFCKFTQNCHSEKVVSVKRKVHCGYTTKEKFRYRHLTRQLPRSKSLHPIVTSYI